MSVPLLATKFYIPPLRPDFVARPRLTGPLRAGLERPGTLILLSGPAGSGKTTLLGAFVTQVARPVAWLSLDEGDDEPRHFWRLLLTACRAALDGVGEAALALLEAPERPADDTIPSILINDLARRDQALLLVLDDYHVVHNPFVHAGLSFLLDHLPGNLHVALSTRVDPPLPLARYRARNRLVEVRARDLRFNQEETAHFLTRTADLDLSPPDVAVLAARTEGWAAGLQLAALALRAPDSPQPPAEAVAAFIRTFSGSHLYVAEYLLDEVLRRQTQAVHTFLLQTSILDRLTAGLCAAVTGEPQAGALLDDLRRANIFVIPLDGEGRWFRYHHLFADLLRARLVQELPAASVAALHARAADWYRQQGLAAEAVHHALKAEDYEQVAMLVEQEARSLMFAGRASTLRGWLSALPPEALAAHPRLEIYRLWIDLMQGNIDIAPHALEEQEQLLRALPPSPENERLRLELTVILCRFVAFSGETGRAIRLAQEALAHLPPAEEALRARAHSALAIAYWIEGEAQKAAYARENAVRLARATGNDSLAAHVRMMQGTEEEDYGRLRQAARTYQGIIRMGEDVGREPFFPAGQGYIGLAGIHLEWNELEQAERALQQGMELCRQGGLAGLADGHILRARLCQAKGDLQGAADAMRLAAERFQGVNPSGTVRQVHLHLALGDLQGAARLTHSWLDRLEGRGAPLPLLVAEVARLTLARLFIAQEELARARLLLDEVAATAGPAGRNGRLLEYHLLAARLELSRQQEPLPSAALAACRQALTLAQPERYTLLFLEEGPELFPLLRATGRHPETAAHLQRYAQSLLVAAGQEAPDGLPGGDAGLVEPLTPREMEVLQLIAAGHSNRAIAAELFIAVRTVKKHAGNIYGKLDVGSRTQAVARARQLGLLPAGD